MGHCPAQKLIFKALDSHTYLYFRCPFPHALHGTGLRSWQSLLPLSVPSVPLQQSAVDRTVSIRQERPLKER